MAVSGNSNVAVVFDSKRTTPSNSRINKKQSTIFSNPSKELNEVNSSSINTHLIEESFRTWETGSNRTFSAKTDDFDKIVERLNHKKHSHIRENECFLNEQEIKHILSELGYDIYEEIEPYYLELLNHLEVNTYGGVPSQNLKILLQIVSGTYFSCRPNTTNRGSI